MVLSCPRLSSSLPFTPPPIFGSYDLFVPFPKCSLSLGGRGYNIGILFVAVSHHSPLTYFLTIVKCGQKTS